VDGLFVQVAEAGSLGGGMLSYLLKLSCGFSSCGRFLLNFLRSVPVDSGSDFSTGLGSEASLGVNEKLGARGPFGLGCADLLSSVLKFGRM
jgi:hypothetical protein